MSKAKEICKWISGFGGGTFLGALIACPEKEISLPVSTILTIIFAYLGWKR